MANSNYNLEGLIAEFKNAESREEQLLLRKLQVIKAHLADCGKDEFIFADEIVNEFCRVIYIMKEQEEKAASDAEKKLETLTNSANNSNFLGAVNAPDNYRRYDSSEALLIDFYNAFRNEQKRKNETEKVEYPAIERLSDLTEQAVNSTVKDYVARINTFARRYMFDLPRTMELWYGQTRKIDPITFTFYNIELVLAEFDTKNEDGSINKQKSNIQSALRKLNEFKRRRA